jgi:hypothetical protein
VQELYDAAFGVLPYLKASTDKSEQRSTEDLVGYLNLSAGDRLRFEAAEADRKDAAIVRLREALTNFAAGEG